jgi:hypothetical protein
MENTLINYIRKQDGTPRGVVVAVRKGDNLFYGYSLRNPIDRWDKKLGLTKALARANAVVYQLPVVTDRNLDVLRAFAKMESRALKYFKDLPKNRKFAEFDAR